MIYKIKETLYMKLFQLTREYEGEIVAIAVIENRDLLTDDLAVMDVCKKTWPTDFADNIPAKYTVTQMTCKGTYCNIVYQSAPNNCKGWKTVLRVTLPNDEQIKFTFEEGISPNADVAKTQATKSLHKLLECARTLKEP